MMEREKGKHIQLSDDEQRKISIEINTKLTLFSELAAVILRALVTLVFLWWLCAAGYNWLDWKMQMSMARQFNTEQPE